VRRTSRPRARLALVAGAGLLVLAVLVAVLVRDEGQPADLPVVPTAPGGDGEPVVDPYAWDPDREDEFVRRAAAGNSHLLYLLSPGGAVESAERTARWRPLVDRAANEAGVDPNLLEALVLLESAGRENARAPGGIENAAGLTQILAETAENLLGMRVDVEASRRYTRRLGRAERRAQLGRVAALLRARRRVDERFDPEAAVAGTARYLQLALERFGREDLAFVSYHMGIGNLEDVLRAYAGRTDGAVGDLVEEQDLSYAQVYFDSTPMRHAEAQRLLSAFGDDSSNYLWKLAAAREIMRLWREDRPALERLAALHAAGGGGEAVLHPPEATRSFATRADLERSREAREIIPVPDAPETTGLQLRGGPAAPATGLRPEALALALYIGAHVRAYSGDAPLVVGATVRDATDISGDGNPFHATGWALDIVRDYRSERQALAFQFVLDRLRSLNVIAWTREPRVIHMAVSRDAKALLPLLDRVG